ncbi:MAG: hypothetical protein JWN13_1947 [Betaproteobacteria bacterium]|nr:hypothetical protein [Betaproteobacteria bacterium]
MHNAKTLSRGASKGAAAIRWHPSIARVLIAGALIVFCGHAAAQPAFPSKPIRIIVPFSPGGTNDILARLLAPKLTEALGQQAIVDNRPGGNTVIASEALLKSAPDGHTLLLPGNSHVLVPYLTKAPLPFDSINDFAPVATLARTGLFLVVHPALPVNTLKQFIALAKSRPGELNSAAPGGSINQLATEMFNSVAGVKIVHIAYKGSGPAVTDLMGGHAQLSFQTPATVLPFVTAGRLKALAISGEKSFPNPKVPTFTEAGLPGFDVGLWYGLLARGGTPKNLVDRLSSEIAKILAMGDFREKVAAQGLEIFVSNPEQYGAMLKAESQKFARVVKAADIKPE